MTIIFPRELPAVGFVTADLALNDPVKASASGARLVNYSRVEDRAWEASLVTRPLRYSAFAEVEAWWLSLRSMRAVLFRNPRVCYPKAHWHDNAPADVAGVLDTVTDGNVLSVSGVSAALALSVGDWIGLEHGERRGLCRAVEASGSGTSRTITVEPPPLSGVAQAGAAVRFARPGLVMGPVPGSFSAPESNGRYSVSFRLVER